MSDWQVGDLALCINNRPDDGDPKAALLTMGRVYTVAVVGARDTDGRLALGFRDIPVEGNPKKAYGFTASRFVKATPDEADAFDLSVIEQMTGTPVEVAA